MLETQTRSRARTVGLSTPLGLRAGFWFPLQSPLARREVLIGALWLLVAGFGFATVFTQAFSLSGGVPSQRG
jgi:hypothetical protein